MPWPLPALHPENLRDDSHPMSRNTSAFLVNVPALNPGSNPHVPEPVRFLNPGVADGEDPRFFRPAGLPMSGPVVAAMMAQFAQVARESRSAAELSAFAPGMREDFHAGTSFAVGDAIEAARQGREQEIKTREMLSKAQTELCLAWALEKSALELAGLQDAFGAQWSKFERDLGLDEEGMPGDEDHLTKAMPDFVASPKTPKPSVLVDAVLAFLPETCGLYCSDASLLADWEEYGVSFSPAAPETLERFGLTGTFKQAMVPGHLLCLSKRPDPDKPWQAAQWLVVAPEGE